MDIIAGGGFMYGRRNGRKIGSHVMLEAVLTNVTQQFLHLRDLDYLGWNMYWHGGNGAC